MVGEIVCEMKGKEIKTFGNFNEMQLLKYALMLARMGLAILNCQLHEFGLFERLCLVAEEVWEMKQKEVEAFGYINDLKLLVML